MKKFILFLTISLFYGFVSCETANEVDSYRAGNDLPRSYVYKERDPNLPLILSMPVQDLLPDTRSSSAFSFEDCLGSSWGLDYYPVEHMDNLNKQVIDMDKVREKYPTWIISRPLRSSSHKSYSFATSDSYAVNSSVSAKITSGWQVNLGVFKIGNKQTMYQLFSESRIESSNQVGGQVDIIIDDHSYELEINTHSTNLIKLDLLHPNFRDFLYNLTPSEFMNRYGGFILTHFKTGARATAMYSGLHSSSSFAASKEESMSKDLKASYSFKMRDNGTGSFELAFGGNVGNSNGHTSSNDFTSINMSYQTMGGAYSTAFSTSSSLAGINLDLSSWASSVTSDNCVIADIYDGGLLALPDLIMEENLQKLMKVYYSDGRMFSQMIEPQLVIYYEYISTVMQAFPYVTTRYGDLIELGGWYEWEISELPSQNPLSVLGEIADQLLEFYNLRVIMQEIGESWEGLDCYCLPSPYEAPYGTVQKFTDTENQMIYLLYPLRKTGLSIYTGYGGYLLRTYGIQNYVDGLPEIENFSRIELLNYKLAAL